MGRAKNRSFSVVVVLTEVAELLDALGARGDDRGARLERGGGASLGIRGARGDDEDVIGQHLLYDGKEKEKKRRARQMLRKKEKETITPQHNAWYRR